MIAARNKKAIATTASSTSTKSSPHEPDQQQELLQRQQQQRKNHPQHHHHPPGWMDYLLDTCSIDNIFGCDENCAIPNLHNNNNNNSNNCTNDMGGGTARSPTTSSGAVVISPQHGPPVDYAARHDVFLDSLLYEQVQLRQSPDDSVIANDDDESHLLGSSPTSSETQTLGIGPNSSFSTTTSISDGYSLQSSRSETSTTAKISVSGTSLSGPKKSIAVRLKRRSQSSPCRSVSSAPSVVETDAKIRIDRSRTFELEAIPEIDHNPSFYIHPQCRIQKDSGKGDDIGSKICARGIDACLVKLRAKMKLLTEHALALPPGDNNASGKLVKKGPATMKRRNARVSAQYENYIETRSLIELRMGFLSMTYGVLLRWDIRRSGQISLIVLRKNCHDSFYPKTSMVAVKPIPTTQPQQQQRPNTSVTPSKLLPNRKIDESTLQPPYRIPRPDVFDPKCLSVSILYAIGLNPKSHWTIQLVHGSKVETVTLLYDTESSCLTPKGVNSLRRKLPETSIVPPFDIKLFEQRSRRKHQRKLVATMTVPVQDLEVQPAAPSSKPFRLRVPCQHDPAAAIQVEVLLVSDYAHWVQREIAARRKISERTGVRLPSPNSVTAAPGSSDTTIGITRVDSLDKLVVVDEMIIDEKEDEDSDDHWDWICCVC